MNEWWEALSALQRGLFYLAIPSSTFMLAQLVMTMMGIGGHVGDGDGSAGDGGGEMHDVHLELHDGSTGEAHDASGVEVHDHDSHIQETVPSHGLSEHDSMLGFRMLSIRSIIALLVGFSWTSLALLEWKAPNFIALIGGAGVGFGLMFLVAFIMSQVSKLKESGNVHITRAIGQSGSVYIPIPARRSGSGKIQITIQGCLRELDAVTYDDEILPTGADVIVVEIDRETSTAIVTRDKM